MRNGVAIVGRPVDRIALVRHLFLGSTRRFGPFVALKKIKKLSSFIVFYQLLLGIIVLFIVPHRLLSPFTVADRFGRPAKLRKRE